MVKKKLKSDKEPSVKKRSASKPTTPINLIRGTVGNRKEWGPLRNALERVKADAPTAGYGSLYALAGVSPLLSTAYAASRPMRDPSKLMAISRLDPVGFYRELSWARTSLCASADRLNAYVPLRNEFFDVVASGDFGRAILVLNKIDRTVGVSLWAVENRIALLTLQGGFENQKAFVKTITTNHKRTFLAFFAANISERNESRVTLRGFITRLSDRAKKWNIKPEFLQYIFYRLVGSGDDSLIEAANLLAHEGSSSTIDLYQTVIDVLSRVKSNGALKGDKMAGELRLLRSVIRDEVLVNLSRYYGEQDTSLAKAPVAGPSYLESFLCGRYDEAESALDAALVSDPLDVSVPIVHALLRSMGHADSVKLRGIWDDISRALVELTDNEKSAEAADNLLKLSLNLRWLPFSSTLSQIAKSGEKPQWLPLTPATAIQNTRPNLRSHAWLSDVAPAADSGSAILKYERLKRGISSNDQGIDLAKESHIFAKIDAAFASRELEEAIVLADDLAAAPVQLVSQMAASLKAWALFEDGATADALLESVTVAVRTPWLLRSLPLERIVRTRGFRDLKQLQSNLLLPCAFQLYISITDDRSKEVALQVAWKQLLKHYLVSRPSELALQKDRFERAELIYFFSTVCTQEVMELGGAFNSPTDLDEERLQVCVFLSEFDSERASEYSAEIIELTRRLSIEAGVRQVESSRVYVDLFGLERWAAAVLQEPFLRYLDYVSAGLDSSVKELEDQLTTILKHGGKIKELENFLDDYDISADAILGDLIRTLAEAFMTLPRYGLDAFLGSRVRHGSLEGGFRSPLEFRHLVTKIDARTGEYQENSFWSALYDYADVSTRTRVQQALRRFSKDVDALIDKAVTKYVYVRSDANSEGLISLWASEELRRQMLRRWVISVKVNLSPRATITDFVNHCVNNFFWPALEQSLHLMQEFISNRLATEIHSLLDRLLEDVTALVPSEKSSGIVSHVRVAKQEVTEAAVMIAKWFITPEKPQQQHSFSLKTAIEIGLESTRRIRPHFNPSLSWEVEEAANVLLITSAFEAVNDMAFLIFGNISKHGGFPETGSFYDERPGVEIRISRRDLDIIDIRVESDISGDADEGQILQNIETAKRQIEERRYDEVARKQRGTGLVRLASTFNYEGARDRILDFGVTENLRFFVYLSAPVYYFSLVDGNARGKTHEQTAQEDSVD